MVVAKRTGSAVKGEWLACAFRTVPRNNKCTRLFSVTLNEMLTWRQGCMRKSVVEWRW